MAIRYGLARNFDEQCAKGKYFGRFGRNGGTWRCQLKKRHLGNHVDTFGRSWARSMWELDEFVGKRRKP
jgi:hypothetical protein